MKWPRFKVDCGYYNIHKAAIDPMMPIPLTLLTGFLGAGKTSLVNALLREPQFAGTAVLINELGEISVDHDLVAQVEGGIVSTTTGCLCCSATSDVKQALFDLWSRHKASEIPAFTRVVIETTGLVDPAPVIASLIAPPTFDPVDRTIATQFALTRVLTLLDALHGEGTLDEHLEALKQLALADLIVLSKTDLAQDPVSKADVDRLRSKALNINPSATVLDRQSDWASIMDRLLEPATYDLRSKGEDAIAWLAAEQLIAHEHSHEHTHTHAASPDPNRHTGGITSHVIVLDEPVPNLAFHFFLEALKMSAGTDLLRMKGLFKLADDPERPVVAHGVQRLVHPIDRLPEWPSEDRRTRVVVIGHNLNIEALRSILTTVKPKTRASEAQLGEPSARAR
ncbi:MAG: CobW family GTP-binding protein [Hyphomicrobiaceae bacterium]